MYFNPEPATRQDATPGLPAAGGGTPVCPQIFRVGRKDKNLSRIPPLRSCFFGSGTYFDNIFIIFVQNLLYCDIKTTPNMILTIYTATTLIIIAYLLGSIPSAVWIGKKYYGIDIREYGSKNAGTTNMLRVLGRRAALPVFALDFIKGFVAVTIIELMQYDELIGLNDLINLKIGAVFAAVLGHIFPIFAGFRGGKGVATLVGAVTGIYPPVALLCFGVWFVVLMIFHYVSLASMIAGCCFPAFTLISPKVNGSIPFVVFSFVIAILLIYTHRKNIERLKAGTESKIYIWKPRKVKIDEEALRQKEAAEKAREDALKENKTPRNM